MNVQKHEEIIRELKRTGRLFEDADFPPGKAVFFPDSGQTDAWQWLRPSQIQADAKFIKEGQSRFDINQGGINNCWILVAIAALTERPELLSKVVLPGQTLKGDGYCGAFRFRFMQFGREVEVMVDDRLPVDGEKNIQGARPLDGEYWVCLLEKAFAKLHRSYEALEWGYLLEGLVDMTGGVCEMIYWTGNSSGRDLPGHVRQCLDRKLFAAAATKSALNEDGKAEFSGYGIAPSHAYSVTGVTQVEFKGQRVALLRVSNPYGPLGKMEWQGSWSDNSPEWTEEQRRQVTLTNALDGEGWMPIGKFEYLFYQLAILHLARNSDWGVTGAEWLGYKIHGQWTPDQDDAVFLNDKNYEVNFTDRATDDDHLASCIISLEEPDQRHLPRDQRQYANKAVHVYRHGDLTSPVKRLEQLSKDFRAIVERVSLPPGRYILVPKTVPSISGASAGLQFLLRVFTEPQN